MAKTITDIANEVLEGKWGSGDERKKKLIKAGYNYEAVQTEVSRLLSTNGSRAAVIANMEAWAIKIANNNHYYYKNWSSNTKTHDCPVCHPELMNQSYSNSQGSWPKGYDGWNCIGFASAIWHHGGRLKMKCSCHTISDENGEKIYNAKTDAEALKLARKLLGIDEITVIRNNKKAIPKSKAKPGDICLLFDGNTYKHMYFIMSGNKVADSTGSGSKANQIRADRAFDGRYVSGMKVIIRYTGNGTAKKTTTKKSIDEIANEVIAGKWDKGVARKEKLTKAGYDYDTVQKRVGEILNAQAKAKAEAEAKAKVEATKQVYGRALPTYKLVKSNAEVIADAIKWAKWIASDNRFHYGYTNKHGSTNSANWSPNAHHNGCYFCGTNTDKGGRSKKGIVDYKFTYCCNPFVNAAWAHGGCVPKALSLCQSGDSWDFHKGKGYDKSSLFDNLGKPAKSKLKAGDVLCSDSHVALYIGNGKIVEASGGDDNKKGSEKWNKSIRVAALTDDRYSSFKRVHRFNGKVSVEMCIRHGEVGTRVAQWQAFLDWYFEGKVGGADGLFGDNTLKWTKKFQEEAIGKGQGDGLVGPKTLEAASKIKK